MLVLMIVFVVVLDVMLVLMIVFVVVLDVIPLSCPTGCFHGLSRLNLYWPRRGIGDRKWTRRRIKDGCLSCLRSLES